MLLRAFVEFRNDDWVVICWTACLLDDGSLAVLWKTLPAGFLAGGRDSWCSTKTANVDLDFHS